MRSVALPLPSSPHWAPTSTIAGMSYSFVGGSTDERLAAPAPAHISAHCRNMDIRNGNDPLRMSMFSPTGDKRGRTDSSR
ncbi:hypothetical protein BN13_810012 [Nostocoides jenkinsii Ben 74]|uniref:Uncharacterized protein n=1 Tax=Nostocoides jenkinsii Ben 74 TaxID=1193518 RepID=A0A077MBL1_9MICO|nr:hypothetical protein BN13_810012 [Tetrasphaera jenkinsii Ben 74]